MILRKLKGFRNQDKILLSLGLELAEFKWGIMGKEGKRATKIKPVR